MIPDTIEKIEARLRENVSLKEENRLELLALLEKLRSEVGELARTNADQASSITGFAALSTHEATREEKNPQLAELSRRGLQSSVEGFEESHPRLVQVVNAISNALANLGI